MSAADDAPAHEAPASRLVKYSVELQPRDEHPNELRWELTDAQGRRLALLLDAQALRALQEAAQEALAALPQDQPRSDAPAAVPPKATPRLTFAEHALTDAVTTLVLEQGGWSGTLPGLLRALRWGSSVPAALRPSEPQRLATALRDLAPRLEALGVEVVWSKSGLSLLVSPTLRQSRGRL